MAQRISRAKQTHQVRRRPISSAARRRAGGAVAGRPPCPVPDLQRGLHGKLRPGPAAGRADDRGDPSRPRRPPTAARRRRGRGVARAHAADRRPPIGPDRPDGRLVPLAEQDRSRWDRTAIREGVALVTDTLARAPLGPYQVQAAIAAIHDEAARAEDTDWAPDRRPVRVAGATSPEPDGHAEPGRRRRDGRRP